MAMYGNGVGIYGTIIILKLQKMGVPGYQENLIHLALRGADVVSSSRKVAVPLLATGKTIRSGYPAQASAWCAVLNSVF